MTEHQESPVERGAVRAKSLFWRKGTDHPQDDAGQWIADGLSGRYSAAKQRDGSWLLWWAHDNFIWEACTSFAEVKAKAEADWQKRFAEKVLTASSPCAIEHGGFLGPVLETQVQDATTTALRTQDTIVEDESTVQDQSSGK